MGTKFLKSFSKPTVLLKVLPLGQNSRAQYFRRSHLLDPVAFVTKRNIYPQFIEIDLLIEMRLRLIEKSIKFLLINLSLAKLTRLL